MLKIITFLVNELNSLKSTEECRIQYLSALTSIIQEELLQIFFFITITILYKMSQLDVYRCMMLLRKVARAHVAELQKLRTASILFHIAFVFSRIMYNYQKPSRIPPYWLVLVQLLQQLVQKIQQGFIQPSTNLQLLYWWTSIQTTFAIIKGHTSQCDH